MIDLMISARKELGEEAPFYFLASYYGYDENTKTVTATTQK